MLANSLAGNYMRITSVITLAKKKSLQAINLVINSKSLVYNVIEYHLYYISIHLLKSFVG